MIKGTEGENEKVRGWKSIAAELGVSVTTAQGYARCANENGKLEVCVDHKGIYTLRSVLEAWKASKRKTLAEADAERSGKRRAS